MAISERETILTPRPLREPVPTLPGGPSIPTAPRSPLPHAGEGEPPPPDPLPRARERGLTSGWLLPIGAAIIVALTIELAYVLAVGNAAGRGIFLGQIWAPHDVAQYIAAMNDGAAGAVLIRDRLSSEPHDPAFIYGFYVALGWLAHAVGSDAMMGYRLAGVAGRVFVLLALYGTTALVTPARWRRQVAFVLIAFGGGLITLLGLVQTLVIPLIGPFELPVTGRDLEEPEFGTFLLMFASPHLMFGLGLMMLAMLAYARAWRARTTWSALLAAVLTLGVGLVNSYSLGTLCAVVGMHALAMTVLTRRIVWRGWIAAALVFLAAAPVLLYGVLTFVVGTDPFWGVAYGKQNVTPTPSPSNVLVAYGLVLALAAAALPSFARRATPGRVLVLTWIAVSLVLMYLPVGVQRRFAFGLQPMLALVAAFALPALWRWVLARRPMPWRLARPFGMLLLLQALVGSAALLTAVAFVRAGEASSYTGAEQRSDFFPAALGPAGVWLGAHAGPDDVVLAQPMTGNYLVQTMPGRVYVGHWSATVESRQKGEDVAWLFSEPLDEARRVFLADRGVRYVVVGPLERAGADWLESARVAPWLSQVFTADGVVIYEVEGTAAGRAVGSASERPASASAGGMSGSGLP